MPIDTSNVSFLISMGSALAVIGAVFLAARRFAELELKVNTMWAFQMRRAFSEVVTAGIGTVNSPIVFKQSVRETMDPIKGELVALWAAHRKMDDGDMLLEIERLFGERLLTLVCVPCGLSHGACLLLALSVAKGELALNVSLYGGKMRGSEALEDRRERP